jgi:hypothetical protein
MNARTSVIALMTLAAASAQSRPLSEARAEEPTRQTASGIAIVELFTSEGCSSCPSADLVLSKLAQSEGRGIYALAFHVDYWDDLGWRDRFASPDNTARQQAYAHAFGMTGVYTPQMIVGGTEQFTGSDRDRAAVAVTRALARPPNVHMSVRVRPIGSTAIAVDYEAPEAPAGSVLNLAAIEWAVSTSVRAGENAGRTLRHNNVVRAFLTTRLTSKTGSVVMQLPPSLPRDGAELVAYVQRPSSDGRGMPVLGATHSPLAPP